MSVVRTEASGTPPWRSHVPDRHLSRLEMCARHHRRQRVQNAMLALTRDVRGEIPRAGLDHVARELTCDVRREL